MGLDALTLALVLPLTLLLLLLDCFAWLNGNVLDDMFGRVPGCGPLPLPFSQPAQLPEGGRYNLHDAYGPARPDLLSLFISRPLLNMQITINEIVENPATASRRLVPLHNLSFCQICHHNSEQMKVKR